MYKFIYIRRFLVFILSVLFMFLVSCSSADRKQGVEYPAEPVIEKESADGTVKEMPEEPVKEYAEKKQRDYNLKFIAYDINIDDPAWDRRSYYKVFIDKVEAGRTTIGLESQKKVFESNVSVNRHLLVVEKWALDEKKGQYIKLNNIEQPKPGYVYFNMPDDKTAVITLKNDPFANKSEFDVEFE